MDFRETTELDSNIIVPLEVRCDEDTRIRVYCGQLMDEVIENIHSKNDVLYHASLFYKIGDKLAARFPHRCEELVDASILFWGKVQAKVKKAQP